VVYRATFIGISSCAGRDMPVVVQPLCELPTLVVLFFALTTKSLWSIFCGSGSSRNGSAAVGILRPSQRDMPSHSKIRRIWRSSFHINGCSTVWTVALRRLIFKRKKGFATISLILIYHSIPQLPFCDTFPLTSFRLLTSQIFC
jgi:hypothetical protein